MDLNFLLDHVSIVEAQNRNEEMMFVEEVARHRDTTARLNAAQDQITQLKEREKYLVEKATNATAIKGTLEITVNQLTSDLKGSKTEMTIFKEYVEKLEKLSKSAKIEYLNKIVDTTDQWEKQNSEWRKTITLLRKQVGGPQDMGTSPKGEKAPLEEVNALSEELTKLRDEAGELKAAIVHKDSELKELTEQNEKFREYPPILIHPLYYLTTSRFETSMNKTLSEYQDYVGELQAALKAPCPNCGRVDENNEQ